MTTLFSVFAPFVLEIQTIKTSMNLLLMFSLAGVYILFVGALSILLLSSSQKLSQALFPTSESYSIFLVSLFSGLGLLNLTSMVCYSFPVTTTLSFNLTVAVASWVTGIMIQLLKYKMASSVLPSNTPWYLVPFLCLVELVSTLVRPLTLCFRLLANMTAGHVLLALICKMNFIWTIGCLFGILELMVALVQAFVFSMLISVYLEEAFSH